MTAVRLFIRQMLWRSTGARDVPEPIVALLGPRGCGKTTALRAMSRECGGSLVHALLDFATLNPGNPEEADPVAAVAYVAFELMRSWTNLPHDPTFHRVGLSMLALNENLTGGRDAARVRIRQLIRDYAKQPQPRWVDDAATTAATFTLTLTGISATPLGKALQAAARPAIAALLRVAGRRDIRRAQHWLSSLPEAEEATTIDSLIRLSRRLIDPLDHLMDALLADVVDNAAQWSVPVRRCECELPEDTGEHEHAWVLLLDNVGREDDDAGRRFLAALVKARQRRADARLEHDPLLVVAAVDRWVPAWRRWWREPWQTAADAPTKQPIPLLSRAGHDMWTRHATATAEVPDPARAWYPVWLDPPDPAELAALAPIPDGRDKAEFDTLVRRLSGGLPAAATEIGKQALAEPGGLSPLTGRDDNGPLWKRGLAMSLPAALLVRPLWRTIPDAVAVAVQLREPGGPTDELDPATFPEAARILRLLRENLWISTFAASPTRLWPVAHEEAEPPAALHPWLTSLLLAGLAEESKLADRHPGALTWEGLFTTLAQTRGRAGGRDRELFYDLACGRFASVVSELVRSFPVTCHQEWVRLLHDVTEPPCRWPGEEPTKATVDALAPDDQPGRSAVEATVTSLVALLWLYRDPLTVPNADWDQQIRDGFRRLANNDSARVDVNALIDAAQAFSR